MPNLYLQDLQFMSTNTKHEGRSVLAVWVNGAMKYLPVSGFAFTKAVRLSDLGATQQKRSLLAPTINSTVITDSNSCRRSCNVIYLDAIPAHISTQLRKG